MNYFNPKRIVFLSWALIIFLGFLATHFYQHPNINYIWTVLTIIGLFLMYKHMPLRVPVLKKTMVVWVGVLGLGMLLSFLAFYIENLGILIGYLGVFWLILMGLGHLLNKMVYPGQKGFILAGFLQIFAGILIFFFADLWQYQYLIAAIVGGYGMIHLTFYSQ